MKPGPRASSWGYRIALAILLVTNLAVLGWVVWPTTQGRAVDLPFAPKNATTTTSATASPTEIVPTASAAPSSTPVPVDLQDPAAVEEALRSQGLLILAMRDGQFSHLFAYHPLYLPLTRLTRNAWDDASPALSPDGQRLAYRSRQNGYWDLYILDLGTGEETRLTDTPEFEDSPTWSPDGLWIAYERYNGVSLDIYIQPLDDLSAEPIQLTDDPGIDRSPAWSPGGREIAFVSSRTGEEEIWLARLDNIDDRFYNASNSPQSLDRYPAWSPDGRYLAWSANNNGDPNLAVWDSSSPEQPARLVGEGDQVAWSPDGSTLFSNLGGPNATGLAAYAVTSQRLSIPYMPLPGEIYGLTWVRGPLPEWLAGAASSPDQTPAQALWQPVLTKMIAPAGRAALVELPDVTAPQATLQDAVDEAFVAMRQQIAQETGWDVLSSLENAFVPLTTPTLPSFQDDWLYTGRAIALNPLLLSAGWMSLTREDYQGQTFWRVYLKARYQDGSMGAPLTEMAWDLNARYSGDTRAYEQGGQFGQVPTGYWIDLTEIARRYGWERLPSSINWRTFYGSIRFNQFVMTGGLEWRQAMADLYPPEALVTSTPLPTFTSTSTRTPQQPPISMTVTPMPTITSVPTRRPTWTPLPEQPAP